LTSPHISLPFLSVFEVRASDSAPIFSWIAGGIIVPFLFSFAFSLGCGGFFDRLQSFPSLYSGPEGISGVAIFPSKLSHSPGNSMPPFVLVLELSIRFPCFFFFFTRKERLC